LSVIGGFILHLKLTNKSPISMLTLVKMVGYSVHSAASIAAIRMLARSSHSPLAAPSVGVFSGLEAKKPPPTARSESPVRPPSGRFPEAAGGRRDERRLSFCRPPDRPLADGGDSREAGGFLRFVRPPRSAGRLVDGE
jgi:hypothetical protein